MSTFTATANNTSTLGYATYGAADWQTGTSAGACQGSYNSSGNITDAIRRVGLIVFEGAGKALRGSAISKIVLQLTASSSGYQNRTKTLYLRKSNYQTIESSVKGSAYVGDLLGTVTGYFYKNTYIFELDESNNPELFANLKQYLREGNSAVVLFDEANTMDSGSAKYSLNYLRITNAVITVTYEDTTYVFYHNGTEWVACAVYYHNGSEWVLCVPYYNKDGTWIQV